MTPALTNPATQLPDGFELLQHGRCTAAVRSAAKDHLLARNALDPDGFDAWYAQGRPLPGGRGHAVSAPFTQDARVVIRRLRRAGPLGKLLRGTFLTGARPIQELAVAEHARAAGVPAPEYLAALLWRRTLGYTAALIVRELPDALSLEDWLRRHADSPDAIAAVVPVVADAVARLCAANVCHPDLHAGNVLIQDGPRAHLIDFDKARILPSLPEARRNEMLFRFNRALVKRGLVPRPVTRTIRLRFARQAGIPHDALPGFARACQRHLRRHAWRYPK